MFISRYHIVLVMIIQFFSYCRTYAADAAMLDVSVAPGVQVMIKTIKSPKVLLSIYYTQADGREFALPGCHMLHKKEAKFFTLPLAATTLTCVLRYYDSRGSNKMVTTREISIGEAKKIHIIYDGSDQDCSCLATDDEAGWSSFLSAESGPVPGGAAGSGETGSLFPISEEAGSESDN